MGETQYELGAKVAIDGEYGCAVLCCVVLLRRYGDPRGANSIYWCQVEVEAG